MRNLFIVMFILLVSQVYGRNYQPLLSNGKSWTMIQTNTSPVHGHDAICTYRVDRDTVINAQECKVVMRCKDGNCDKVVMMEKEQKVFYHEPNTDSFLPILDFSLHQGDEVGEWGWVLTVDEIIVNGTPRKRLFIGDKNQIACVIKAIWVEGIGSNEDCWITLFEKHIGDYSYMMECSENGKVVFTHDDFSKSEECAYMSVLAEGRQWKLSYTYRDTWQDIPDTYMTIAVDGDTIVDGRKCKKLLVDYRNLAEVVYPQYIVAYETNGRVYRIDEGREEHLVMDMNLHQGDAVNMVQNVLKEDTVIVDGIKRKRLMIDSGVDHPDGEYLYYLVEGIGMSKDEFVNLGLIDENIYFHRLIACYDNGKCVFSAADFLKEGTSGLNMPKVNCPQNNTMYDLQGKKRSSIKKGEIFIRNGKKYINRSI